MSLDDYFDEFADLLGDPKKEKAVGPAGAFEQKLTVSP